MYTRRKTLTRHGKSASGVKVGAVASTKKTGETRLVEGPLGVLLGAAVVLRGRSARAVGEETHWATSVRVGGGEKGENSVDQTSEKVGGDEQVGTLVEDVGVC